MWKRAALAALGMIAVAGWLSFVNAAGEKAGDAVTPSPTAEKVDLPKADKDGWITLFDGRSLKGWYGDPKIWRIENGYISGKIDKVGNNTFLVYNHPFADFELTAKCMLIKGKGFTNSGIQYRSKVVNQEKWIVHGYQADMGAGFWGILYEEGGRGILGKKQPDAKDPKEGDWADYKIVAQGNHLQHFVDRVKTLDFVDDNEAKAAKSGIIALQYHAPGDFEVRFKDIKIKILESKSKVLD